ncbi:DUF3307 domain-containing protein [Acinetobacter sp.]|uniref:DUF3307 domain-containing protein n=1 Tax=Acinetobacter sp. TaxID=472 RepID=UPI00388E6DE3
MTFAVLFFALLFAHALADYPLQGSFLSEAKNRNTPIGKQFWMHALPAHAIIHGGFVMFLTSSLWLGLADAIIHGVTDWLKCEGKISLHTDQAIHLACKLAWAIIVTT